MATDAGAPLVRLACHRPSERDQAAPAARIRRQSGSHPAPQRFRAAPVPPSSKERNATRPPTQSAANEPDRERSQESPAHASVRTPQTNVSGRRPHILPRGRHQDTVRSRQHELDEPAARNDQIPRESDRVETAATLVHSDDDFFKHDARPDEVHYYYYATQRGDSAHREALRFELRVSRIGCHADTARNAPTRRGGCVRVKGAPRRRGPGVQEPAWMRDRSPGDRGHQVTHRIDKGAGPLEGLMRVRG